MITILRQKYENLVDVMENLLNKSPFCMEVYAEDLDDLKKQVLSIRTIQKSLRLEDRT